MYRGNRLFVFCMARHGSTTPLDWTECHGEQITTTDSHAMTWHNLQRLKVQSYLRTSVVERFSSTYYSTLSSVESVVSWMFIRRMPCLPYILCFHASKASASFKIICRSGAILGGHKSSIWALLHQSQEPKSILLSFFQTSLLICRHFVFLQKHMKMCMMFVASVMQVCLPILFVYLGPFQQTTSAAAP